MAAAISLTKIGEAEAIPSIDEVLDNTGLREKLGLTTRRSVETASTQTQGENITLEGGGAEVVETDEVPTNTPVEAAAPAEAAPVEEAQQTQETNMFDAPPAAAAEPTPPAEEVKETNIFDNPPSA